MRPNLVAVLAIGLLPVACAAERPEPSATPETSTVAPSPVGTSESVATPTADPFPGRPLIDHVVWTSTDRGRQLQVFPTQAGRDDHFRDAGQRAWAEVRADAPDADTPGMLDQFLCHWDWARAVQPTKPSWDLEPWRPAVGYQATVDAACNPGGPEG